MNSIRFAVAALFFSLIAGVTPVRAQKAPTIYVGLVSVTPTNTPLLSAVEGGYFKKYGLDVKPLVMSGSSTALAALLSEEMSFITIAGSGVINAHLAGRDAVMIAGTVNYAPYEMVVSKDIKTVEDLKGKKLGIARFGGSADFLARWGLEKHGLTPGKDVIILQTGGNPERLAAVSQGAIQATLLEQSFAYRAKRAGLHTLIDYSTIGLDYQHSGIGTTKSFVENHHELTTNFLKALIEGIHRMKTDRDFAMKVIEHHLRTNDPETLKIAYEYNVPTVPDVPYVNLKGIKFLLDYIGENNPKAKTAKPEDIGDNAPLKEIAASGFLKTLGIGHF
ncbi:MAG TPA: ABC transporter substrate-binding protein [Phototrophicaceae bacterium]|jgi:NitT/TauT family transport system substrate-binding protein|nr:ABC transporter substrate-binding protein [Phototrophicaceae bacterium]